MCHKTTFTKILMRTKDFFFKWKNKNLPKKKALKKVPKVDANNISKKSQEQREENKKRKSKSKPRQQHVAYTLFLFIKISPL